MNGRIYDPVLRTFLSADPYIQDPSNSQNYNRYAYCVNNPLMYTDHSGNIFGIDDIIISAIIIGALIGGGSYAAISLSNGTFSWGGLAKSIIVGAVSGAATSGIGTLAQGIKVGSDALSIGSQLLRQGVSAVLHGVAQGVIQGVSGGDVGQSFLTAAISSVAAGAFGFDGNGASKGLGWANSVRGGDVGQLLFGTIAGGVTSDLQGGNFWTGAAMGLTVSGLNHAMHAMSKPKTTVAGIYGAGGDGASGNPELKALVEAQGGTMFTSSAGGGDDEIIAYLKAGFEKGNSLKIYGHSRGGAAAVRIANKLGAMHINISEMTLYDPVALYGGGSFNFDYPNVMKVTNYYQRNPTDHLMSGWEGNLASNPFQGSPVSGSFQWPAIRNVNYTGNLSINHINITGYAIKNP